MVEAGVSYVLLDEKITVASLPDDFDDIKSYFRRIINTAILAKYKMKILKNSVYNSISINMSEENKKMFIGILLMQKTIGVDRVYECNDGIYIMATCLISESILYALEIMGDNNEVAIAGPDLLEQDTAGVFHAMIDYEFLRYSK